MIQVTKVIPKDSNIYLTDQEIYQYCQEEKDFLSAILPEIMYLDYVVISHRYYFQVMCSYRETRLFSYKVYRTENFETLENWLPTIFKYVCKTLCMRFKDNLEVTSREVHFLIDILNSNKYRNCIDIMIQYFRYLPIEIKQLLKLIIQYVR